MKVKINLTFTITDKTPKTTAPMQIIAGAVVFV